MLSYRERRRASTVREIKDTALRRLTSDGPEGLALRAIARDMGLSVQSLYHYFASRDHLIAELVEDGHNGLADALERARDAHPESEHRQRLIATSLAYREWSVSHRSEFQLIYGTPIAGYQAPPRPEDGRVPASARIGMVFQTVVFAGWSEQQLHAIPDEHIEPELQAALAAVLQQFAVGAQPLPPAALQRFLRWWGQLHGLITLEVFGHLSWVSEDAGGLYRVSLLQLADEIDALAAGVT